MKINKNIRIINKFKDINFMITKYKIHIFKDNPLAAPGIRLRARSNIQTRRAAGSVNGSTSTGNDVVTPAPCQTDEGRVDLADLVP